MAGNPYLWSTTAATNSNADADINWVEGQLPSTVNDSARGMMAGVAGLLKDTNSTLTTGGSANAHTVTSNINYPALATGIQLHIKAGFTNTAACTLNLTPAGGGAFGAKAIKIVTPTGEADPAANNIRANGHYILEYDAAANAAAGAWILLNPSVIVVAIQTFTASGTYTPRAGLLYAIMEAVAGGAGGAGSTVAPATTVLAGGGGGAGGYSRTVASASTIGASQTVTIGAGGAADSAGGDTSVGTLCIAKGGSTGGAGGGVGGLGGIAGTGTFVAVGDSGGGGGYFNVGSAAIVISGGKGGSSVFGGGGIGGVGQLGGSLSDGVNANNYGGGGGGGCSGLGGNAAQGGTGKAGCVIITEYSVA